MAPPKAKGQKMALGDFLQDKALGSWADEMEDVPMPSGMLLHLADPPMAGTKDKPLEDTAVAGSPVCLRSSIPPTFSNGNGEATEKGGYSVREQLPLPTKPPFTVHLGNMSFDATEGDIQEFFRECSVTNVRIVEDKAERKPKGFGYAEFSSLEGLKKALTFNNTQFQGRNIRVSVAEPQKDRPDAREFGDWTRKGPLPDIAGQRRPADRFGRDNSSEAGGERDSRRRPGYEQADGKVRDLEKWDRKGPLTPILPNGPSKNLDRPVSHDGPRDRRNSPAWGEARSQDGSRPPRREFSEKPLVERAPTAPELDNQWRTKMRPDPPAPAAPVAPARSPALSSREISAPSSPSATSQAPTVRPKLNLAKRTVTEVPKASPTLLGESKSSPFGGATPIDTAAREKEIEEKRQHALREKKEADEKAREEKKLARDAERSQRASVSKEKSNEQDTEKENGAAPQSTKTYEILRRMTNDDTNTTDTDTDAVGEVGTIVDDKSVKPKEITRDIAPKKLEGGALANGNTTSQADVSADTTAGALEGEGWSTVSKPRNQRRNGNQASRAMAS